MKKAIMTGPGELVFKDYDVPKPGEGEVLVKVRSVGICTWEQGFYKGMSQGFPFIGGHEICGEVHSVGEGVAQDLKKGDRVVVASLTRCGECYYCRKGMDNLCSHSSDPVKDGEPWGPGGFSEYFIARGYEVYKIDPGCDFQVGTLAEPLACVIRSLDRSRLELGDKAVVLGGGVMGMLHMLLARSRGASVLVSEPDPERRRKALELGADAVVDPLGDNLKEKVSLFSGGMGAEAVFFTAGGTPALKEGITLLAKNGTMVVYGAIKPAKEISLDPMTFHYDEIYLTGVTKHTKDTFRRAAELISSKQLPLERLISASYPFGSIEEAFTAGVRLDTFRVVLDM